jgi:hypothetical protein
VETQVGEAKIKKSLRETHRPLKSLETAKSSDFRTQRYQELSKTQDFAGEAISFRFAEFSFRGGGAAGGSEASKIWKNPLLQKKACSAS